MAEEIKGRDIDKMVRNYTAEQFALAWTVSYFDGKFSMALRYMRELSQGKTEDDYSLFANAYQEGVGTDHANMELINDCLKECIKEYLFDYKLFWDVVNRAMRRAYERISKGVMQTNTGI